jgi:hypothetical protein
VSFTSHIFDDDLKINGADDRWRDDVWTMKYLSGFKWEMLGEQVGMSTFQFFF